MLKFIFSLSTILLLRCSNNVPEAVEESQPVNIPAYGTDSTFDIATWNLQYFPKNNKTAGLVKEIIDDIDVDLIAVQEIASITAFNQLINTLPGWQGELSSDTYADGSYQKTGILYKSDYIYVSASEALFTDDKDAFPRPPLKVYVEVRESDSIKYDFSLVILHLKASGFGDEQENIRRRRKACQKLEAYIAQQITNGSDADFIVMGDWNDELSDATDNVFTSFLDKSSSYAFLTLGLADASYPSYKSLIDHILITADSFEDFNSGNVSVLKLDTDLQRYANDVSDHRPVAARFHGFNIRSAN